LPIDFLPLELLDAMVAPAGANRQCGAQVAVGSQGFTT
jgi:hypothetical protein